MTELSWQADPGTGDIRLDSIGLVDRAPVVHVFPGGVAQLSAWRMRYGGGLAEAAATELGLRSGWAETEVDQTDWMGAHRVNTITGCFPTWEADSYAGFAWYRCEIDLPDDVATTGQLRLGAPADIRALQWWVWLDGAPLTTGPVTAPSVDLTAPLSPGHHVVAVQLRITPEHLGPAAMVELEGWRRVDPLCHSSICWDIQPPVVLDQPAGPGAVNDATGRWRAELDYRVTTHADGATAVTRRTRLRNTGGDPVVIDQVEIGGRRTSQRAALHPEGAWSGFADGWMVAALHPAAGMVADDGGVGAHFWPGVSVAPGAEIATPDLAFDQDPADWRAAVHRRLAGLGPARRTLRVYDPYGWNQISHPSEPKTELDVALVGQVDDVLADLAAADWTFTHLALDCGWNDPDDLSRFHPVNFPDGPGPVLQVCRDHDLDLILWVSPSEGARAFRHELGMHNPGMAAAEIGTGHRLCPAAQPWRGVFTAALDTLVEEVGADGFKIDGTELYCTDADHGHLPGIWSVWATTGALIDLFEHLRALRPDLVIMLYWGLRSPWWLRWADTVWEGAYLVEAAAPSGRPAWTLRASVACSQDHGRWTSYPMMPPHRQDSLGVWLSDTLWASRQGSLGWDDAMVLDAARGGPLTQPWGDLRPMAADAARVAEVAALLRRRTPQLAGNCTLVGNPTAEDGGYGYCWTGAGRTWVVVSQPGPAGTTLLPPVTGTPRLDYLSTGALATIGPAADGRWQIAQSAGSVAAYVFADPGPDSDADPSQRSGSDNLADLTPGTVLLGPVITEVTGPADELDQVRLWTGRIPMLGGWGEGPIVLPDHTPELAGRVPPEDRLITGRRLHATATVELARDARGAVVVRWRRGVSAWHNDALHEVTQLALRVDGVEVPTTAFPDFRHDQAGSWSWMRFETPLAAGHHDLTIELVSCAPASVDLDLAVWVR